MNSFIIVYASQGISKDLGLAVNQDPIMTSIILSFLTPHCRPTVHTLILTMMRTLDEQ